MQREELDFQIQLDSKDFVKFNLEYRRMLYVWFSLVYFLIAVVLFLLMNNDTPLTPFKGIFALVVGVITVVVVQLLLVVTLRLQVGRMFKSDRLLQYAQHYRMNPSELSVQSQVGDSRMRWEELYRAVEYPNSIALFVGRNRALVLPKRMLDEQMTNGTQEVKRLIRECLPPNKVKFKR
ncbi:hypothetical protein B9G55_16825 [Saccharibacillus sp. O16]|nr:hypothetical protein B9G55_16825 [Saccharibacillus sp. O16]